MERAAMWIPFVYFFVSAPDCLLAECVWLCRGLGLVSGYYKVKRKRNNRKALVLREYNEQKGQRKKKKKIFK